MEWFDTNVGSSDAALQQAPEVLESVRVNLPVNVLLGMVNDFVSIFLSQSVIGCQRIGVERRAGFDMLFNRGMESRTLAICDYRSANLSATFQCSEYDGLVFVRQYQ